MKFHITVLLNFRAQSFSVFYSEFWLSSESSLHLSVLSSELFIISQALALLWDKVVQKLGVSGAVMPSGITAMQRKSSLREKSNPFQLMTWMQVWLNGWKQKQILTFSRTVWKMRYFCRLILVNAVTFFKCGKDKNALKLSGFGGVNHLHGNWWQCTSAVFRQTKLHTGL